MKPPSQERYVSRRDVVVGASLAGATLLLPRRSPAQARGIADVLPFDPVDLPSGSARRVWAHWHVFPTSFDNKPAAEDTYAGYMTPEGLGGTYRDVGGWLRERPLPRPPRPEADWAVLDMIDEIQTARAIGLDGFQFNVLSIEPDNQHWLNLNNMLKAAARSNSDFQIMLSLDCAVNRVDVPIERMIAALAGLAKHPSIGRHADGRLLLGAFAAERWPAERWQALLTGLAAEKQPTFFMPHFLDVSKTPAYLSLISGASVWGGNHLGQMPNLAIYATALRAAGKTWIAPVYPQDFRPKDGWFAEAENSRLFRTGWQNAIDSGADMVAIATWDDYSEHSEIKPSTGTQYSFYDLSAYFISWFKTGNPPNIVRDVLYYFHRIESTDATATGSAQPKRFFNRFADPTHNEIELLAFLTAPGHITITTPAGTVGMDAPAGVTSLRAPVSTGRPTFQLLREDEPIITIQSAFAIREKSLYQDLLYRGGSSSRPPVQRIF